LNKLVVITLYLKKLIDCFRFILKIRIRGIDLGVVINLRKLFVLDFVINFIIMKLRY
jgi:hypothetical protein